MLLGFLFATGIVWGLTVLLVIPLARVIQRSWIDKKLLTNNGDESRPIVDTGGLHHCRCSGPWSRRIYVRNLNRLVVRWHRTRSISLAWLARIHSHKLAWRACTGSSEVTKHDDIQRS